MKNCLSSAVLGLSLVSYTDAFLPYLSRDSSQICVQFNSIVLMKMTSDNENGDGSGEEEDLPLVAESTVKVDDGGSDLTDRFKYKVHALMGDFDPPPESVDDENQSGSIMDALTTFPTRYDFNVVGRTSGSEKSKEEYIEAVKKIVSSSSGDDDLETRVTPRGKSFTRLSVSANVDSAAVINSIYDELAALEITVMRY